MIAVQVHETAPDKERFQLLVDSVTDYAIYMLDPSGIIASWNSGAQRFKGYIESEVLGEHFSRFYTEEDRASGLPQRALDTARREGKFEAEGWRVRKDGTHFWAHVVIDPIIDGQGNLIGFAKITRDLTERRKAEEALRESERRFRLLVQGVTDYAIYMLDPEGHISNWNPGAQRIKGYTEDEVRGQHFSRFYTEEDRARGLPKRALEIARREGRFDAEGWRVRKDGTRFWASVVIDAIYDDDKQLIGFAKITRDITERRNAQEALEQAQAALFQAQKMETVGQLTGGIAHDFNNLLTIIVNSLDLLTRNVSGPRETRLIEGAQRAAQRGAQLTQQLLAFSRRQPLQPARHNPNSLIEGFETVLRRACGELVRMSLALPSHVSAINVDGAQFEAALLNLVVNARDAMPDGGELMITVAEAMVNDKRSAIWNIPAGPYVVLTVQDTGIGMTKEVAERVFEPFFTTKEIGKGTGLGLSQVYGFITQSGGHIEVGSEPGKGTTITMLLPAHGDGQDPREEPSSETVRPARDTAGTVLIVEDEPAVLDVATEIFESLGYDVLTATDAIQAIGVLEQNTPIDVLFSDVIMPNGMNGVELSRKARELRPGIKVLLASGYPMSALPSEGFDEGVSFISKPYRWTELSDKLRALRIGS
ncbi:hybrid sensor histidine kinase/response regulator [Microvirga guangxiensis]|uniref:histidine kinase n=1 Tax=Microvirga guangxiensis TaxID=549386 RepID=A0A1G5JPM5_9HYPH|nr:PAS domain-containing sensor histidine kinase [Microvirga guangxiensis]SCY90345.1 His Kinase A (phospho-acceptor) domain-containing protein [Microvirga guangxiensis]